MRGPLTIRRAVAVFPASPAGGNVGSGKRGRVPQSAAVSLAPNSGGSLCSTARSAGLVEAHEVAQGARHGGSQPGAWPDARLQVELLEPQQAGGALQLGVEAAHQAVAVQDRQAEVAPLALRAWLVALQHLPEPPHLPVAPAGPEQAVERAQEGGAARAQVAVRGALQQRQVVAVHDQFVVGAVGQPRRHTVTRRPSAISRSTCGRASACFTWT